MKKFIAPICVFLVINMSSLSAQDLCTGLQSAIAAGKSSKFMSLKGNLISENKSLGIAVYQSKLTISGSKDNQIITDPDAPELNEFASILATSTVFDANLSDLFNKYNTQLKACLKGWKFELFEGNADGTVDVSGRLPDLSYSNSSSPVLVSLLIKKSSGGAYSIRLEASLEEEDE